MTKDSHGNCPACGAELNGGSIWRHFRKEYHKTLSLPAAEAKADATAAMYGATRTSGQWGREIAVYDRDKDRTVAYQCPDCQHEWPA